VWPRPGNYFHPMRSAHAIVSIVALLVLAGPAGAAISQRNAAEHRLVHRINHVRANHGLPPLRVATRLQEAATRHSNSMARLEYFRHELRYQGTWKSFATWIHWYWPGPGYTSWGAGENLAWGAPDLGVRKTVSLWMHSADHRANLLSKSWRRIGVSIAHVTDPVGIYSPYSAATIVTADFGRRSR
jgi:uncharacterized protein YkwD